MTTSDDTTKWPKTELGRLLRRGETFDPECHRTTHRLHVARQILNDLGITPTVEHFAQCASHPSNRGCGMRDHGCWSQCETTWSPEWVTGTIFDAAGSLASAFQDARGSFHRHEAEQAHLAAQAGAR